jgi:hypothetical protein
MKPITGALLILLAFLALPLPAAPLPDSSVSVSIRTGSNAGRQSRRTPAQVAVDIEGGVVKYEDGRTFRVKITPQIKMILRSIRDAKTDPWNVILYVKDTEERPYNWVVSRIEVR